MQSLLKNIVVPDISYQYKPNFIRYYFQPLLRYSLIKFTCVALKSRYPSVIWCQEKNSPEKSPHKGSGVGLGLGLESWGLFTKGTFFLEPSHKWLENPWKLLSFRTEKY